MAEVSTYKEQTFKIEKMKDAIVSAFSSKIVSYSALTFTHYKIQNTRIELHLRECKECRRGMSTMQ